MKITMRYKFTERGTNIKGVKERETFKHLLKTAVKLLKDRYFFFYLVKRSSKRSNRSGKARAKIRS